MPVASTEEPIAAPSLALLLLELRVFMELPRFVATSLSVENLPRGKGQPIMIVPGFGASDLNTAPLRLALRRLGYSVFGWNQGVNVGMRPRVKQALTAELRELRDRYEDKITLIGWSLGGVFAREMARHQPECVRRVITLGSPINGDPEANNLNTLFRLANLGKPVKTDLEGFRRRVVAPPVPCVAIHTKTDGLVAWQCSLEEPAENTRNIEVHGSHMGLVYNAQALAAIASVLAEASSDSAE